MNKIIWLFAFCLSFLSFNANAQENDMKIKLTLDKQEIIIRLNDNAVAKQLLQMLPHDFEFRDFAGEEKITYFPKPISLENAPHGMIAKAGKLFIYAPWKNMGIFYKTHSLFPDDNLIELGEVESGLNILAAQKNNFTARVEIDN